MGGTKPNLASAGKVTRIVGALSAFCMFGATQCGSVAEGHFLRASWEEMGIKRRQEMRQDVLHVALPGVYPVQTAEDGMRSTRP